MVSSESRTHDNLPLPLTSFVGREAELEEVRRLVRRDRLVTLTGAGGSGKTRLALEVARSLAKDLTDSSAKGLGADFPDGIWLVELASLRDPSLVARELASVLGVGERPGRELEQVLPVALRDERCLILLDNCEHLVGMCAELSEGLLRQCPGLAVLATSREPLGAAGERMWPVAGLSVPESPSLELASRCESTRLFVERAAAASPGFELTQKNGPAVAEVCRRLEGVPLAIELAAARVSSMTVAQISARLNDALGLLTSGPRTAAPRQSTLRATIDWSHDLLSPPERALFRNLSVFSGGFTLEAAEEVCAVEEDDRAGEERVPVLDLLSQLVDKSLVRAQRTGEAARYHLPEVIRQYAAEKLEEAGETETLRRRHAIFFRDFAEEAEPGLDGPDREFWLDLVEKDLDNFRAAMSWAADSGEAELGLRLASALAWFWLRRSRLVEGRASLERALEAGTEPPLSVAKAIHVSGALAWAQGDRVAARSRLGEAVMRFKELDDYEFLEAWLSSALSTYSLELLNHGEIEEALTASTEGVAVGKRHGENPILARALTILGIARLAAGDFEGAKPPLEEGATLSRRLGDGWLLSVPLGNLAVIALRDEDYEKAQSLAEESVQAMQGLDDKWLLANSLAYLAIVLAARSSVRRAAAIFGASEAMREAVGQEEVYAHYRLAYDRGVESARKSLGEKEFAAAWAAGREMNAEEAISFALEEEGAPGERPVPALRILALGQSLVEVGGRSVEASDWKYAKVAELFFYLISHPPTTRERIGLDLWPDASPSQLRNALHSAMYGLRKALGPPNRIHYSSGRYTFDHTLLHSFDARDFEEKTRRAHQCAEEDPVTAAALLEEAAELYRGDFLENLAGEEWIFVRQQELRESYIESQLLLGQLYTEQDKNAEAARAYRRAITLEPYSGEAHAGLIRAYSRLGEQGRALQHYQDLEDTFQKDLGATPPPEVTTLIERLRRSEEL
ncbi:MAG: BTAD domain-containing putative transcriptional regulator [Rubrobacteraceae bacterium]